MSPAESIKYARTRDGVNIAFVDEGEGFPIVGIPPWISHLGIPFPPRGPIPGFRVIMYDKRGCGLSDRNVADLSLEARMLDLEAVVAALGLERFAIGAASEAGPLALAYAAANPERVSRLLLIATFANGQELPREIYEAVTSVVKADWNLACETLAAMFAPPEARPLFVQAFRNAATQEDAARMWSMIPSIDVTGVLDSIECPVMVIHGTDDRVIPFDLGRKLAGAIPHARLVPVPGGHVATQEELGARQQAWMTFLAEELALPEVARALGGDDRGRAPRGNLPTGERLTSRETEVLERIAEGKTNAEIAAALVIAPNTVATHVKRILTKTGAANRTEAVSIARRLGILD